MSTSPLEEAARIIGSQVALAAQLGVTKAAVGQWKLEGRKVPAEHCPVIERLTDGHVRCEDLRPDIDWAYLRNASPRAASPDTPTPEPAAA